jgi:cellobiose phosphorylase
MYRLGLEGILGLQRAGAGLIIEPHIPAGWPGYEVTYRYGQATYAICVRNDGPSGGAAPLNMTVDGKPAPGNLLALHDDGEVHQVQIALSGSGSQ